VTHGTDEAIDGALYVAEVSAACVQAAVYERYEAIHQAVMSVPFEPLHDLIEKAMTMADAGASVEDAAMQLGCSGYVMHSIALATFCFLRFGDDPREALIRIVGCGGDTDSNAAILGAWLGALHGRSALPEEWLRGLVQGPVNLDKLALAMGGHGTEYGGFSYVKGVLRNWLLLPAVLVTAIVRLFY
jgi:ADP-ribosylglycohydrolase